MPASVYLSVCKLRAMHMSVSVYGCDISLSIRLSDLFVFLMMAIYPSLSLSLFLPVPSWFGLPVRQTVNFIICLFRLFIFPPIRLSVRFSIFANFSWPELLVLFIIVFDIKHGKSLYNTRTKPTSFTVKPGYIAPYSTAPLATVMVVYHDSGHYITATGYNGARQLPNGGDNSGALHEVRV